MHMKVEEITGAFNGLKAGDRISVYAIGGRRRLRETKSVRVIKGFTYSITGTSITSVDFKDGSYLKLLLRGYCWFLFSSKINILATKPKDGRVVTGVEIAS